MRPLLMPAVALLACSTAHLGASVSGESASCTPGHAAHANGIEIEYETFGRPEDPAVLLIMGLGAQMLLWEADFCSALARRGFYVIRFDNRDVGLSTKFSSAEVPNIVPAFIDYAAGRPVKAPYQISDMAADAVGLLDALDIRRAHVVGASLGGIIAQEVALAHPDRVLTLTSIMSTMSGSEAGTATPEAARLLSEGPAPNRDAFVERALKAWRVIGSPGFPPYEDLIRRRSMLAYDRCYEPTGTYRQMLAVWASPPRKEALRSLKVRTLVIHGDADTLLPLANGIDTARTIPDAHLEVIAGMGHDLPPGLWPRLIDLLERNANGALPQ
jgi:pimeloyl-ACP methyl ester carboxylesterase